ncbi:MAG: RnfABCDGE type electron transport complex subunit B [Brachymonas sp.]|nr:RnfABCDGE type electron transport complex subunit B [Brachymonas sp.]
MLVQDLSPAAAQLHAALPQTQCQRCGYPDCASYAQAIAHDGVPINQCPPGGNEGIARLAVLTGRPVIPLNPAFGQVQERTMAFIDEDWCIGCTLCIKACPVDAIVGASKQMHTIIETVCTGCELCVPACPVDCIEIEIATPGLNGWAAWSQSQADEALNRYQKMSIRRSIHAGQMPKILEKQLSDKLQALQDHPETVSRVTDSLELEKKRRIVAAALEKARQQTNRS